MAHTVIWSPAAQADIAEIGAYLEVKVSTNTAKNVITAIRAAPYRVNDLPLTAYQTPELKNKIYRETSAKRYRVMFRIEMHSIVITRIVKEGRLLANVPGSFEESEQEAYAAL
jgi:plasmid stabilization system protein ParE